MIKPNNGGNYQASLCIEKYQSFELVDLTKQKLNLALVQ